MRHFLGQALRFLLPLAAFAHVCVVRGSKALPQRCSYPVSEGRRGYKQVRSPSEPWDDSDLTTRVGGKRPEIEVFLFYFSGKAE